MVSDRDRKQITAAATDYIEAWVDGDAERMAGCMHPELIKRSVSPDPTTGGCVVRTLSREQMVGFTRDDEGAADGGPYEVTILDAYGDIASVSVLSSTYVDYLQLARCGDRWLLLNVLWQHRQGRGPR
jgi:hypothetical protein